MRLPSGAGQDKYGRAVPISLGDHKTTQFAVVKAVANLSPLQVARLSTCAPIVCPVLAW